jgi:hypothetical protein
MSDEIRARLEDDGQTVTFHVARADWHGRKAKIELQQHVAVKRSGGIAQSTPLSTVQTTLAPVFQARLSEPVPGYAYRGAHIDMGYRAEIKIDDGVLVDSKRVVEIDVPHALQCATEAKGKANELIQPKDRYSLLANMRALSPADRLKAMAMSVVCGVLILVNMAIGWHDQWVPESQTYFYDHHGTKDGRRTSESPLMKAAGGSAAVGAGAFALLLAILRRYMKFELTQKGFPRRGSALRASELIRGVARVPLQQVRVRIVAASCECGQVRVQRNKRTETQSFAEVVHAVCLYDKPLAHVPAGAPLERYLDDEVDVEAAYRELLPPHKLGKNHGVGFLWEAQLIHPEYVDQEAKGDDAGLHANDFARWR